LETIFERYTGLPDSYRKNAINIIAGASDAGTFGVTHWIRKVIGANRDVDLCSEAYRNGEWGSLLFGGLRLAYAGLARVGAARAANGEAAVLFRNRLKRVMRGPLAGTNYRIKSYETCSRATVPTEQYRPLLAELISASIP
jgi:hypothetical protein